MKNKKVLVVILFMFVLLFSGCSKDPKYVKLLDEDKALKYVESNYGKAELVGTNKDIENSIKYTFVDSEYKFQYTLTSTVEEVNFPTGFYHHREFSDFEENYYNYLLNALTEDINRISSEKNVRIIKREKVYLKNMYVYEKNLFDIYNNEDNMDLMEEASNELIKAIKKIDNRNFFKGYQIFIYSTLQEDDMGEKKVLERNTL